MEHDVISSSHHLHCLVCGDVILKQEIVEDGSQEFQESGGIYKGIFKLFEIKLNDKSVLWSDEEESPFCTCCENEIVQLVQLRKQLEEIKQKVDEGKRILKDKLESSEGTFESIGIYQRDGRYLQARNLILKRRAARVTKSSKVSSRKSARKEVKTNIKVVNTNPKVFLSLKDKKAAEEYGSRNNIKLEDVPAQVPKEPLISDDEYVPITQDPLSEESLSCEYKKKSKLSGKGRKRKLAKSLIHDDWESSREQRKRPKSSAKKSSSSTTTQILPDVQPTPSISYKDSIESEDSDNFDSHSKDDEDWEPSKDKFERKVRKSSKMKNSIREETTISDEEVTDSDSDSEEDEEFDSKAKQLKVDKITGSCSYLYVTIDKVDNEYKCRNCEEFLPNAGKDFIHLRHHILYNHTNLTICKHCGQKFNSLGILKRHIKHVHEGFPPLKHKEYPCPICEKPVSNRNSPVHRWSHYNAQEKLDAIARGEKDPKIQKSTVQCDICGQECSNPSSLRKHQIVHHPTPENTREKKICPICGRQVLYLGYHLKRHEDDGAELWFQCSLCSKGFPSRRKLNIHKRFHELPFKCTMCDRGFASKGLLQNHVNLHLGIRPYKCSHCEASFAAGMHLNKHVKKFHTEGANPKRKFYQRGLTKKPLEGSLGSMQR